MDTMISHSEEKTKTIGEKNPCLPKFPPKTAL
jgi:hypothetical protein